MKSKIIQLLATHETKEDYRILFALCKDGSVWYTHQKDDIADWQLFSPPHAKEDGQ